MFDCSEAHGLSLISDHDKLIYSAGISTGGVAEVQMARSIRDRRVIATTIDPNGASFASNLIDQASLSDQIKVKIEDIAKPLPYASGFFDFVYARLVLHYLPKTDLQSSLEELYRILKPNGKIFIVVRSINCLEAQEGCLDSENGMTTYTSKNGSTYSRYFHSESSICDFLKTAQFKIIHVISYNEQLYVDFQRTKLSQNIDNLIEVYASKTLFNRS